MHIAGAPRRRPRRGLKHLYLKLPRTCTIYLRYVAESTGISLSDALGRMIAKRLARQAVLPDCSQAGIIAHHFHVLPSHADYVERVRIAEGLCKIDVIRRIIEEERAADTTL